MELELTGQITLEATRFRLSAQADGTNGTSGNDTLNGDAKNDILYGLEGDDTS